MIKVEYLNPFIAGTKNVMASFGITDIILGKPYLTDATYDGQKLLVAIGLAGELRGQVIFEMDVETAYFLASSMMMGMPISELNDMSKSAVSELVNMIMGNTATEFYNTNVKVDITPPSMFIGKDISFSVADAKTICIPLEFNGHKIEINVGLQVK